MAPTDRTSPRWSTSSAASSPDAGRRRRRPRRHRRSADGDRQGKGRRSFRRCGCSALHGGRERGGRDPQPGAPDRHPSSSCSPGCASTIATPASELPTARSAGRNRQGARHRAALPPARRAGSGTQRRRVARPRADHPSARRRVRLGADHRPRHAAISRLCDRLHARQRTHAAEARRHRAHRPRRRPPISATAPSSPTSTTTALTQCRSPTSPPRWSKSPIQCRNDRRRARTLDRRRRRTPSPIRSECRTGSSVEPPTVRTQHSDDGRRRQ